MKLKLYLIAALVFTGLPKVAFAQEQESLKWEVELPDEVTNYTKKRQSTEGEFGIYFNHYNYGLVETDGYNYYVAGCEGRAWYLQFVHTWWLNKYIGCSAGGMFIRGSKISSSWTDGDKYYSFDGSPFHINAIGELRVAVPLVWKFGFTLNARIMFSPIPIDVISYSINQGDKVFQKSHYLFTRFNLGGVVNAGLYINVLGGRITLGYGRGSYDVYNSVRIAKIDGHRLSEDIKSSNNRYIHNVFLNLTMFLN